MVPIESRNGYLQEIKGNEKLLLFHRVLANEAINISAIPNQGETLQLYFKICQALSAYNKKLFIEAYNVFSRREPSKDNPQPYVNDDLLIFLLIVGIKKFSIEKIWIDKVIKARNRTESTITFENLMSENYYNSNSIPAITICFLNLLDKTDFPNDYLNNTYLLIVNNTDLLNNKSDLIKISSFRALDLIITLKDIGNNGEYSALKKLKKRIEKRVIFLVKVLYNFLLLCALFGIIKLLPHFPKMKKFIDDHVNLFTFLAFIGVIGVNFIPMLKKWFTKNIFRLLGFSKKDTDKSF